MSKYIWQYSTAIDTVAGMRGYDDFGSGVQSCTLAEPLRYILEERSKRPREVKFEVHRGLHRFYHGSDKKVRGAMRRNKDVGGFQLVDGWNDGTVMVRDEFVSAFSHSDAVDFETLTS